jgi:hypothetical protein
MERRRQHQASLGANLDEAAQEILEVSRVEREKLEDEIAEMRARNVSACSAISSSAA